MKQLDPKAVWLFFYNSFMSIVFVGIFIFGASFPILVTLGGEGLFFSGLSGVITIIALIVIILLILAYLWAQLIYKNYRYELTDIGFKKEEGVIVKKYVTIPYDRIQNVDIYRGIFARILGLSDLHIQTAGMSAPMGRYGLAGSEGRLIGLDQQEAEQLRDELIVRSRSSRTPGM